VIVVDRVKKGTPRARTSANPQTTTIANMPISFLKNSNTLVNIDLFHTTFPRNRSFHENGTTSEISL